MNAPFLMGSYSCFMFIISLLISSDADYKNLETFFFPE